MAKFLNEFQYFRRQPHNMKVLLITNLCFAFVLPVIEIFVGAYIMRNTNNPSFVAVYQLAQYTGIVLSSLINGFLLKRINVRTLYMFGILVSGISLLVMMTVQAVGLWELVLSGLLLGVSVGFFWTNRYLLALNSTTDDNLRNGFLRKYDGHQQGVSDSHFRDARHLHPRLHCPLAREIHQSGTEEIPLF